MITDPTPAASTAVRQAALEALARLELGPVGIAASALAERVRRGGLLHVLGAGHSQLLALEGFYRAGGPAWVAPVLDDRLSAARGSGLSAAERSSGLGARLVEGLEPRGALLVASNSGRNAVPVEAAEAAAAAGLLTTAITSRSPANRLAAAVDHVLNSGVPPGDAAIPVGCVRMGPLSTVVGAVLLHALLAETEARLGTGQVLISSNVEGGDRHNAALVASHPHLQGR